METIKLAFYIYSFPKFNLITRHRYSKPIQKPSIFPRSSVKVILCIFNKDSNLCGFNNRRFELPL